ncbi:DEAD-box ATP-dependent RNA helicase 58, chloroplastic-like isoform X1 [Salvia splendens]|uniref:DEAD-box ATP-dependent RNA helicase 58, chloroplastic-like isoform X1 n=1 Tax=Salvia splendens TaxID=180675 RepID=UPI001C25DFA7|nr:DEAD-box ATP-dependent RNA helicase 58, chloroplastic-like isoform X1 [Salvia splendens]
MASSFAAHTHPLSWTSSMKLLSHSFAPPNRKSSLLSYRRNRMSNCLSLSASVNSTVETNNICSTLLELCEGHVPDHVLQRAEEVGYIVPTPVQNEALPVLFSGRDCVIHAQTGSGKTLAYLLLIFSVVNPQRSSVQAVIVVPTRELGMQVTKVARTLAAKSLQLENEQKSCTVMALLDGGTLRRHKSWLKVEPPVIVIATLRSLCQMLDKHILKLDALRVLVIDEVDFMFNSSKEVSSLKKLLTIHSSINSRQTVFASASIPQHRRFVYDCIQQKWTKANVVHVHVNPIEPMPLCLHHRYVICGNREKYSTLLQLLQSDSPLSAIIFVGEQSEKSKKAGNAPSTTLLIEFLRTSYGGCLELVLLEEDINFNQRATSITDLKQSGDYLLVATDIAGRGVDLPETTHIYNFDIPKDAINYLHRAGRTGRKPFSDSKCYVTSIISAEERFVLQRFENELKFHCEELLFSE